MIFMLARFGSRLACPALAAAAVCPLLQLAAPAAASDIQVIALTGDPEPEPHPSSLSGDFTTGYGIPYLNNAGQMSFVVGYDGPFVDGGFNLDRGPGSQQIARENMFAPAGDGTFRDFDPGPINDAGQVAFRGKTASNDSGLFHGSGTAASLISVSHQADSAPGNGQLYFRTTPMINASGQVAFAGSLYNTTGGGSDDEAIYRYDNAGTPLIEIVRKGDPTPNGSGTFTGGAFQSSSAFFPPAFNDHGTVAFFAPIVGSGVFGDEGVYLGDGSTLTRVARVNDAAPGGGTFDGFGLPTLNNNGKAAFYGELETGITGVEPDGIYLGDDNSLVEIMREYTAAPGVGANFRSVLPGVATNDLNQVAFSAKTVTVSAGGGGDGLWIGDGTTLTTIAHRGDSLSKGGTLNDFATGSRGFALNEAGQLAFKAGINLDSDGNDEASGIFFHDSTLGLIEIARTGDAFLGSTIDGVRFAGLYGAAGGAATELTGFNDHGHVAYHFELTDGREGIALWGRDPGDYDGIDGRSAADIDALLAAINAGNHEAVFDLTGDGLIDAADKAAWLALGATAEGDTNLDGTVSVADLFVLGSNWNQPGGWGQGDFNGDGTVDARDLDLMRLQWGFGTASAPGFAEAVAAVNFVPEPGSITVLSVGLLALRPRRRA